MAMTPSTGSVQNSVMINFNEIQKSGTSVHLQDSSGKTVVSFTPQVQYQSILMSSPDIEKEGSYSLLINDDSTVTFVLSKSILKISESGEEITGGGIGQMGGMRPEGGKGRPDKMPPDGQTAPAVTAPDSIDAKSSATVKN
jgi:hypothetical protein